MFRKSIIPLVLALITTLNSICAASSSNTYAPVAITLPAFTKECLYYDLLSHEDSIVVSYQVLTGGNFEIDFEITAPDHSVITTAKQQKYSDFLLKSFGLGQYSFCFSNTYGTALKKVEVTLELEKENLAAHHNPEDAISDHAVEEIDRNLNKITKMMNYLRAREWRNMDTVKSTESRLVWLSMLTMGCMAGVSFIQAAIVQVLFKDRQRNYV
ncbi:LAMI_0E01574g1_1 [Lachancea mirantina]|uniref:LAMI_0E01574g1_1 n=1 Tax=Lachancea mirantina TaxID=1230905 RepID=A0A1G4JIV7_9SACH|nr:LAMI_0E01574g1_1 [Lachancea mirantina]